LATGETVEQCLRRYPAHADALRPMLQTVRLVQRAVPSEDEVSLARMRSRARVQDALNTAATSRARRSPVSRWWLGVAALLLVCIGVGAVAFNSLPGDPLYALKRGVEDSAI